MGKINFPHISEYRVNKNLREIFYFSGYYIAILTSLSAILIKIYSQAVLGHQRTFLILFTPIVISAWCGGFGPGLLATFITTFYAGFLYTNGDTNLTTDRIWQLAVFFLEGLLISLISKYRIQNEQALKLSEKRFKSLIEHSSDAIILTNIRGKIIYASSTAKRILGYEPEELIGMNGNSLIDKSELPKIKKQFFNFLIKPRTTIQTELKVIHKNGSLRWVEAFTSNFLRDKQVKAVVTNFRDITERKLSQEKLREGEKRFRYLADTAPVMIWMSGSDKLCNYFNKGWLNFTGRSLKQEVGDGWTKNIFDEDLQKVLDTYRSSFDARIPFELEYRIKRHDGKYRWLYNIGVPRFSTRGVFLGYIGSAIDITDRKELEKRKDEFISIASHELKTPVTTIKAFTQLLANYANKDNNKIYLSYLTKMEMQINNLTDLISDLLDVSKIQEGKLNYKKEFFDLNKLIKNTVANIQPTTKHKLILKGKTETKILGDPLRIEQAITNLITNAIKYSPHADKVEVGLKDNGGKSVELMVKDYGIGIPADEQKNIFEKFFQATSKKRNNIPGLGLGLFITSDIIKRHGGTIKVSSEENKGSTFYINLPIKN